MNLYDIQQELRAWINDMIEAEGEVTEELRKRSEEIDVKFDEKAEAYACVIKELRLESTAYRSEMDTLKSRKDRCDRAIERLENRLTEGMKAFHRDKLSTSRCEIKFTKSTAVLVDDASLIPNEYIKTRTETSPDKTKIGKLISSGADVPGCRLEERLNVQVR